MAHSRVGRIRQTTRSGRTFGITLAMTGMMLSLGCPGLMPDPPPRDEAMVQIRLVNDSETKYVAPNLRVCPNGMANDPHHMVTPPPVLAPGEQTAYTSAEIAGSDGDCLVFATDFMIGLCGWAHGPSGDDLSTAATRYGGQIGFQFSCGDTVILRWSGEGTNGGTWTSEVQPAAGNEPPSAEFQEL